jgi:hypothetical protein
VKLLALSGDLESARVATEALARIIATSDSGE